jgi:hypothetical protein
MQLSAAESQLVAWGLTIQQANSVGFYPIADASIVHPSYPREPAIVLPYWRADGSPLMIQGAQFQRIRRLSPPPAGATFTKRKPAKYLQPPKSGVHVYFPPPPGGLSWPERLADPSCPIIITEGEAKAVVGSLNAFPVIALGGVWSFTTPTGALIPDLAAVNWEGRHVYICFDSDAVTNPDVTAAESRLVYELQTVARARCHIVRLPSKDDGSKMGLDDFLQLKGAAAFEALLEASPALDALDAKVMGLNHSLAWIEFESQAYDIEAMLFIKKENLINGSRWSSLKHLVQMQNGTAKEISVAAKWLTHPHARRYDSILFRPNEPLVTVADTGRPALNMWRPWECGPGDVTPWLELTDYLLSEVPAEVREVVLKLMIYKTQNPTAKPALAPLLVGPQGCGKGMWLDSLHAAYAPYSYSGKASDLVSNFQGWLEKSLLVTIHEVKPEEIRNASEQLKTLISETVHSMNEKFRPARQIRSYAQFLISSNHRGVGSFSEDDRRMLVINCPKPRDDGFYQKLARWKNGVGPKHLLHWLLNYDLQGWEPPSRAIATAEKRIAYEEGLTNIQRLALDMCAADQNVIMLWLGQAMQWATGNEQSTWPGVAASARAVRANIEQYQIRPWYTADELGMIFPAVLQEMGARSKSANRPTGQLSRELRDAGVPYLRCVDSPGGFMWKGRLTQFLVVSDAESWTQPITQEEFERHMAHWLTYKDHIRQAVQDEQRRRAQSVGLAS